MAENVVVELARTDDLDDIVAQWSALVASQRDFGSHIRAEGNLTAARDVLGQHVAADRVAVARPLPGFDDRSSAEQILGFVTFYVETGLYEQTETRGIVENIYVIPDARGRGVGSALLKDAEDRLIERGAEVGALSVLAGNQDGQEFYRSHGYEPHRITVERAFDLD